MNNGTVHRAREQFTTTGRAKEKLESSVIAVCIQFLFYLFNLYMLIAFFTHTLQRRFWSYSWEEYHTLYLIGRLLCLTCLGRFLSSLWLSFITLNHQHIYQALYLLFCSFLL
ncbi:hypothetical protein QBC37DRAFT_115303 [Rhypophila decipiens]|uniref:Uncharacterized protein n=1 Tax=Rhypophila decipiens TaxID=261697 RepID=A0AAN6YB76_9PEZI|nr:hypothetical protein QBC37DRAFT_115303 [Rhypophila decipiens]